MMFRFLARYETLTAATVEIALGFGDSNGSECGDYCEIRGSDSRECGDYSEIYWFSQPQLLRLL
jgi:hypothetical protein